MHIKSKKTQDKKLVITAYFKRQFGCFLAAIVFAMIGVFALVTRQFLIKNFNEVAFLALAISAFTLAFILFALTIILNVRMRLFLKKTENQDKTKEG